MEIWNELKASFRHGSVITRLIYVNLAVFLAFRLIHVAFFLAGKDFHYILWFELPGSTEVLLRQPWSLITYMFLHFNFIHILFNLLVLYWFGRIFLDYFSQAQLFGLYIIGGIAGGVLYVLAYNTFPVFTRVAQNTYLLGASAAIIAILIAGAFRDPNREIHLFLIGRIPLKYIALFMILSYIIGISTANAGGNLAHLGGVIAGYWFVVALRKGKDITSGLTRITVRLRDAAKGHRKIKVVHRQPPRNDYDYNRQRAADHRELNRILDKIAENGYESLSREEKETLFRHGK